METKLEPCPKGHKAEIRCDDAYSEVPTQYIAQCSVCEWSNGTWDTKEAAIEAWNLRSPSPATDALVSAVKYAAQFKGHREHFADSAEGFNVYMAFEDLIEALAAVDALKGG